MSAAHLDIRQTRGVKDLGGRGILRLRVAPVSNDGKMDQKEKTKFKRQCIVHRRGQGLNTAVYPPRVDTVCIPLSSSLAALTKRSDQEPKNAMLTGSLKVHGQCAN